MAMGGVLDALLGLPQVSVAAIDGLAVGGGAEISTACDFRVLSSEARLHFIHAQLGVAPGWGGTGRLVAHIGRRSALRVLIGGVPLDAMQALSVGLADQVVDEDAPAAAREWLGALGSLSPSAIRAIKRQVIAGAALRARGLAEEAEAFASVWGGPDHLAALARLLGDDG
jgi:ethylmalonyl-CoA/methylmalonyl-CoA decarboxylase